MSLPKKIATVPFQAEPQASIRILHGTIVAFPSYSPEKSGEYTFHHTNIEEAIGE